MNERGQYGRGRDCGRWPVIGADDPSDQPPLPASQRSWFLEHPWLTFFLAYGAINGVVQIMSGSKPPPVVRFDLDGSSNHSTRRLKRR